jgi:aminoglycoside phosphotransferase (APT) family kinase protein
MAPLPTPPSTPPSTPPPTPLPTPAIDAPRAVAAGEEIDPARLRAYLESLPEPLGGADEPIAIEQFPGGHSNLTYLVRVGARELILRRPPFGSTVKSAHDMGREHRILSRLSQVLPQAPRPIALCDDEVVLGCTFYLMERLRGVILRGPKPKGVTLDEATSRRLSEALVDTLVALHAVDYRAIGLAELGKPEGYLERQVSGWTKRYADARTDDIPEAEAAAAWLSAHLPRTSDATLLHNDFKYDNLVLDPADLSRVVGILDWEMATLGDPRVDLGTALSYWVQADDPELMRALEFGPTSQPGSMTRRQLAERYAERSGRDLGDVRFYYAFGCFKTAVIAQQIYLRWKKGLTRDARFARMLDGVRAFAGQAALAIRRDGL